MALNTLSLPALSCTSAAAAFTSSSGSRYRIQRPMLAAFPRWRNAALGQVVCMAPEEEKLTRRNPLDFPICEGTIIGTYTISNGSYILSDTRKTALLDNPDDMLSSGVYLAFFFRMTASIYWW
ncbi:hypothetical protein FEM48_Zijuj12G0032700 [Ziziphus jujuba var. spinosa]|nr:hypothetical protein FEM48_Zijuj12G0032700 [Ziziphus jujuba var. spinosa]